jgi:hypothetical protein
LCRLWTPVFRVLVATNLHCPTDNWTSSCPRILSAESFALTFCRAIKESLRLPGWLKLLSLLALVLVGSPTIASAHGGHDDGPTTAWGYVAEKPNVDRSATADSSQQAHFFEASRLVPGSEPCNGSCCCCQGMAHCGPSGCSLSALVGHNDGSAISRETTRLAFSEYQLSTRFHCSSGLDRPPKA